MALRFDDCVCGTTTTGAGTLTLAAPPAAFGGIDPDVWARATGVGFGNSAAVLVDYVITEYTDAANLKENQKEAGTGTLTLGAAAGIANCTLARTTIDYTATSLNSQPATVAVKPGTGITIVNAANVLVAISPRALTNPGFDGYYDTAGDNCIIPLTNSANSTATAPGVGAPTSGLCQWIFFLWLAPRLITKCLIKTGNTAATDASNSLNGALYDFNTSGRPGKKLLDFGQFSGANILNTTATMSTATASASYLMNPGRYVLGLLPTRTTPAGTPSLRGITCLSGQFGSTSTSALTGASSTEALSGGNMPDPPALTGYSLVTSSGGNMPWLGLA